jgi:hypothetical protein
MGRRQVVAMAVAVVQVPAAVQAPPAALAGTWDNSCTTRQPTPVPSDSSPPRRTPSSLRACTSRRRRSPTPPRIAARCSCPPRERAAHQSSPPPRTPPTPRRERSTSRTVVRALRRSTSRSEATWSEPVWDWRAQAAEAELVALAVAARAAEPRAELVVALLVGPDGNTR